MEVMAVPAENPSTTTIGQTEPFLNNNLLVAPGSPQPEVIGATKSPQVSAAAAGTEGEETLWEGLYSSKNFLGRAIFAALLAAAWVLVALYAWGFGHTNFTPVAYVLGAGVLGIWFLFGYKYFRARRNYHYRLTTRRLFLTTGILQRRVDQVELVRVKDLYVRQSLLGSWLDVGTVVLVSSEATLPKALLLGIEEPRRVMDLIWYHTRLERDERTTEVNRV
jgi:membrane protein YdbS with pleckstrin-like domain